MMTHIHTNEIKQPSLHADALGFTFVWQGHFLRGIYPESVELAKSYFQSGFINEVVEKGLFPKTWISDFENEQFGLIIEHEVITPVLYSTEWNFDMLKDAAFMVLEIAQIGMRYGYNMVDCHKLNVMFTNNRPVYVDLGSFVRKEKGSTGWNPYTSFLRSYYYILSIWSSGATVLAKRMMAPGIELDDKDYWVYKSYFFRMFPSFIRYFCLIREALCRISVWGNESIAKRNKLIRLAKPIVSILKPSKAQRLNSLERRISKLAIPQDRIINESEGSVSEFLSLLKESFPQASSITFINSKKLGYFNPVVKETNIRSIISVQEDGKISSAEYKLYREQSVCSCNFQLLNNTVLIKGRFPESRLCSEIAFIPQLETSKGLFGIHNAIVFIDYCLQYAKHALVIGMNQINEDLVTELRKSHRLKVRESSSIACSVCGGWGGYVIVYQRVANLF